MKTFNIKNSSPAVADEDVEISKESLKFKDYLMARGYSPMTCRSYAHTLMHERIVPYMKRHYHCTSVYELTDIPLLKRFVEKVNVYSECFTSNVRNATMRYIEYLNEMEVKEDSKEEETMDKIDRQESELAAVKEERDEAQRKLQKAEIKIEEYENAKNEEKVVDHEELVANVFCEIAQRYMESCKRKRTDHRTLIKNSLHDIMSQLKMFGRIPNDLQKCINNFDDETTPVIPHVIVQGDYVLQKHVDGQVTHVDDGGTGISRQ